MYKLLPFDIYLQQKDFIEWIENLSLQGFFIQDIDENTLFVKFKKSEPQTIKYQLYFNLEQKDNEEFLEQALNLGWELVNKSNSTSSLLLFKSTVDQPKPLDSDFNEIAERLNHSIKKEQFSYFFYIVMIFILIYTYFKFDTKPNVLGAELNMLYFTIYFFILAYRFSSAIRKYAIYHLNQNTKTKIIRITRLLRILLPVFLITFTISICSNYFTAKQVQAAVHNDFVSSYDLNENYFTWGTPIERSTQSLFSITPTATYFYSSAQKDLYNVFIYQTRTFHLTELTSDDLIYIYYTETAIAPDLFVTLVLELKEKNYVRFKNPYSDKDYLSIQYKNHVIYTLHTVNISLTEHLNILDKMGSLS